MIYLASPYSDPDPAVREQRYEAACAATVAMLRAGHVVFSPIVHSHPLVAYGLPTDWAFWQRVNGDHLLFATKSWCSCWTAGARSSAFGRRSGSPENSANR